MAGIHISTASRIRINIPVIGIRTPITTTTIRITLHTMKTAWKCSPANLQRNGCFIMGLVSHGSVAIPRTVSNGIESKGNILQECRTSLKYHPHGVQRADPATEGQEGVES